MSKILVSPAGGQTIVSIIEYFKKKNDFVVGIDQNLESIGRHLADTFYQVPAVFDPMYKNKIFDIIRNEEINIFISWLDPEILFWNNQYQTGGIPVDLISIFELNFREDIQSFYDKYQLHNLLKMQGFSTPKTDLLINHASDIDCPLVVKPRCGFGSRGVEIIKSDFFLEDYILKLSRVENNPEDYLIQEFIFGDEFTVDFYAVAGEVINMVIRRRNEHRGVSLRGEIVLDHNIEKTIKKFCSLNKIDGLNNLQLIERNKKYFITDCNMRPSGTIIFSIEAGVDLIENLIERHSGVSLTSYGKPRKLKMIRYLKKYYYE